MDTPPYYLTLPATPLDAATKQDFLHLWNEVQAQTPHVLIDYTLSAPKWQFLNYLVEHGAVLLHGSGRSDIARFEPRQPIDLTEFGAQRAVYAASDSIWAMFFAIIDRDNYGIQMINACYRVWQGLTRSDAYYYFSVNWDAWLQSPWRSGTIYLLPAETFTQQPRGVHDDSEIEIAQWVSREPVVPLARLAVEPADFPFLDQVLAHDPDVVFARAQADPNGFPWRNAED